MTQTLVPSNYWIREVSWNFAYYAESMRNSKKEFSTNRKNIFFITIYSLLDKRINA